jgi:UDP-N-acetylglucosamine/UDP-N-acetylgalactosamine diphosphorylase
MQGCYNVGLPSNKSLFQLQAERVAKVQALGAAAVGASGAAVKPLQWYIMTSPFTHADTV